MSLSNLANFETSLFPPPERTITVLLIGRFWALRRESNRACSTADSFINFSNSTFLPLSCAKATLALVICVSKSCFIK